MRCFDKPTKLLELEGSLDTLVVTASDLIAVRSNTRLSDVVLKINSTAITTAAGAVYPTDGETLVAVAKGLTPYSFLLSTTSEILHVSLDGKSITKMAGFNPVLNPWSLSTGVRPSIAMLRSMTDIETRPDKNGVIASIGDDYFVVGAVLDIPMNDSYDVTPLAGRVARSQGGGDGALAMYATLNYISHVVTLPRGDVALLDIVDNRVRIGE